MKKTQNAITTIPASIEVKPGELDSTAKAERTASTRSQDLENGANELREWREKFGSFKIFSELVKKIDELKL